MKSAILFCLALISATIAKGEEYFDNQVADSIESLFAENEGLQNQINDVKEEIRIATSCKITWGSNSEMVKFCIKDSMLGYFRAQQMSAAAKEGSLAILDPTFNSCETRFAPMWRRVSDCMEAEMEGVLRLVRATEDLPVLLQEPILEFCSRKFPHQFERVAECTEHQLAGWRNYFSH